MKKVFLSVFGIFIISIAIYSCSKESTTSNTSNKSVQKSTVATVKPPRSFEEYMQLEDYVRQNVNISHDQFVQYGNILAFVNNQMAGFKNSSYTEILSPEQFVRMNNLVFKALVKIQSDSENPFYKKVNDIVINIGNIASTTVICYDNQTPFNHCNYHADAQCCCLMPIYEQFNY
jgi:hypothetical protein